ncbi:hypothetical protein JQC92_12450 [Shewanella sp. 202IG2-18]|nr:hypothetical protein [Parashewanella hymeniacidonis]
MVVHLNEIDEFGKTVLHYACETNNSAFVFMLIESGAQPNIRDEKGNTPRARSRTFFKQLTT